MAKDGFIDKPSVPIHRRDNLLAMFGLLSNEHMLPLLSKQSLNRCLIDSLVSIISFDVGILGLNIFCLFLLAEESKK
jgi:hypothetical protein